MNVHSLDGVAIANSGNVDLTFLLDGGATYTSLPEPAWRALGLQPLRTIRIPLPDGAQRERHVGECNLQRDSGETATPVLLGGGSDRANLGSVTLAQFGYCLDPLTQEILLMRLSLKSAVLAGTV